MANMDHFSICSSCISGETNKVYQHFLLSLIEIIVEIDTNVLY